MIKYTLWYSPATKKSGVFNPVVQKEIINSIAELFNGLSIEAGRQQKDIVYDFTMTKLYTQLNSTFKNPSIIKILKQQHMKYSDTVPTEGQTVTDNTSELIKTYSIDNPIEIILPVQKIRSYKLSNGEAFYKLDDIMYQKANHSEPITNCPTGDYHDWNTIKGKTVCTKCNEILDDVEQKTDAEKDTDTDAYYFTLNMIANKRCLSGTMHDFVGKGDKFTCSICGHGMNEKYSKADLDTLVKNLIELEDEHIKQSMESFLKNKKLTEEDEKSKEDQVKELLEHYKKENGDKLYGRLHVLIDKLFGVLEEHSELKLIGYIYIPSIAYDV